MAKGLEAPSGNFIPIAVYASLSFRFRKDPLLE